MSVGRCTDGRDLTAELLCAQFSLEYEQLRKLKVGKRAAAAMEKLEAKKHRTQELPKPSSSSSSGKPAPHRPPPGNTNKIRKLLGLKVPVKPKETGIKVLPSTSKMHPHR